MSVCGREACEYLGELQLKGDQFTKMCVAEKKKEGELEDAIEHITNEVNRYRDCCNTTAVALMNLQSQAPNPSYTKTDASDVSR